MKFRAFIVTIFLAFPIFIRLTSLGFNNFLTVVGISLFLFGFYALGNKGTFKTLNYSDPLLQFNILFITLVFLQWISHGNLTATIRPFFKQLAPFLSSIILIYFLRIFSKQYRWKLLNNIVFGIGMIFLFQFSFSFYETFTNTTLINYGFLNHSYTTSLFEMTQQRSLLGLFGINYFTNFPLTMLLGQWNYSAPLLAIYNLIFLFAYYHIKKNIYGLLLILVLFAALLNTTRASIFAILITDLIFYLYIFGKNKKYKQIAKKILIFVIIVISFQTISVLGSYFSHTDTLSLRFYVYKAALSYIRHDFLGVLWGSDYLNFSIIGEKLQLTAGYSGLSLESQFFSTLFLNGFIGLLLFLRFLKQTFNSKKLKLKSSEILMKLLSLNIILTSITLGGIFFIFTYPVMTILYLNIQTIDGYSE